MKVQSTKIELRVRANGKVSDVFDPDTITHKHRTMTNLNHCPVQFNCWEGKKHTVVYLQKLAVSRTCFLSVEILQPRIRSILDSINFSAFAIYCVLMGCRWPKYTHRQLWCNRLINANASNWSNYFSGQLIKYAWSPTQQMKPNRQSMWGAYLHSTDELIAKWRSLCAC